jgi:pimeloyl-ACP methyl ester carboxylesterase
MFRPCLNTIPEEGCQMLPLLIRTLALTGILLGAAAATASECVDRRILRNDAASELVYECVKLKSGAAVWVGDGGAEDAPVVLLVHGMGKNAHHDWQPTIPALLDNYRVIALDLPGFGASRPLPGAHTLPALARTLNELLVQKRIYKAHVVGHSMGGALSLYFAYAYPQRVDRLALVDAAGILHHSIFTRYATRPTGVNLALLRGIDGGSFDPVRWLADSPGARKVLLGTGTQADVALGLVEYDFSAAIRGLQAPVTIFWGRDDAVAPLRTGELLASRLMDAKLHVLDGVGHVPMTQGTERFNALLRSALAEPANQSNAADVVTEAGGEVVCQGRTNIHYRGNFTSLRLDRCSGVVIESARIGTLDIRDSQVRMHGVVISNRDTAMQVSGSVVTGTVLRIEGETAIRVDDSELDLAGASIRASRKAVDMPDTGRVYFSVSEIEAPDYTGDAHFIRLPGDKWPSAAAKPADAAGT